jgi:hypothetical protein
LTAHRGEHLFGRMRSIEQTTAHVCACTDLGQENEDDGDGLRVE